MATKKTLRAAAAWRVTSRSAEPAGGDRFMRSGDVIGHGFTGCGRCWYCTHDQRSLCDNTHTGPGTGQALFGAGTAAPFVSDSVPTGWMGADLAGVENPVTSSLSRAAGRSARGRSAP